MTLDELKAFFLVEGAHYLRMQNGDDDTRYDEHDVVCTSEVLALVKEAERLDKLLGVCSAVHGHNVKLVERAAELARANAVLQSHARERSGERVKFIEAANAAYNAKRKLAAQDDAAREENARLTERVAELEAEITRLRDITEDDANVECPACSVQIAQDAVRMKCRAGDTERSSRCDFTADQMRDAHAFCDEAIGNEAIITDENGDARLLLVTRVPPLDEEQKP